MGLKGNIIRCRGNLPVVCRVPQYESKYNYQYLLRKCLFLADRSSFS